MADQIFADGPIATPASYEVPGSAAIVPIAVQALLNGSGASGDYVPTLIFRSQAGHVIARVPTSTTVTAGDDAEVSWFPHVGAGAKPPTGANLQQSFVSQARTTTQTIASGVVTALAPNIFTQAQGWAPGTFLTGSLPSGTLTFASFSQAVVTLVIDFPAGAYDRYIELTIANPGLPEYTKSPRVREAATPDGDRLSLTAVIPGDPNAPATSITANIFQASGVNKAITGMYYAKAVNGHIFLT